MTIVQIAILIFSCSSISLFASKPFFRWGFIAGICGQPFWLYETFRTGQWGMFIVSLWFTFSHARGIINHWNRRGE